MKITFSITRWDMFASSIRAMLLEKSSFVFMSVPSLFLAVWGFAGTSSEISILARILTGVLFALVAALAMLAFAIVALGLIVLTRKHRGALGEHVLEIGEEGFRESTRYNSTLVTWDGLLKVRRSGGYAYVFMTEALAHIIPMKKGRVDGDAGAFVEEVERRMKAAQPGATDNPGNAQ